MDIFGDSSHSNFNRRPLETGRTTWDKSRKAENQINKRDVEVERIRAARLKMELEDGEETAEATVSCWKWLIFLKRRDKPENSKPPVWLSRSCSACPPADAITRHSSADTEGDREVPSSRDCRPLRTLFTAFWILKHNKMPLGLKIGSLSLVSDSLSAYLKWFLLIWLSPTDTNMFLSFYSLQT